MKSIMNDLNVPVVNSAGNDAERSADIDLCKKMHRYAGRQAARTMVLTKRQIPRSSSQMTFQVRMLSVERLQDNVNVLVQLSMSARVTSVA